MENEEQELQEDIEPKKPSNPFKKAKTTGKTVVNTTYNFAKKIISFFASPAVPFVVKIAVVSVIAIIIIVVVILDAKADENAKAVNETIKSYMDSESIDAEGKKYFKEKASLIKMPLKDINAMYEQFKNDDTFTTGVKQNYDYILGTKEIKDGDGQSSSAESASYDIINMVKKAVAMAQKGGIEYAKDGVGRQVASNMEELDALKRTDCSGLVWSLFKTFLNIDVGNDSETMKSNGDSKKSENGWTAEIHSIGDGELKPGDILYRQGHVGLYVGSYGTNNHVDHGGGNDGNTPGPNNTNYEGKGNPYTHYIRYTNPNATSNGGTADPNGNEAEGYARAFTDSKNRTYKEYGQSMSKWSNVTYWGNTIPYTGCGPTALAIIASGYGINETPETIANKMTPPTSSTELSRILSEVLGLKNTVYENNQKEKMIDNLKKGRPVVISVLGTEGGADAKYNFSGGKSHIITALAINDQNQVYIANPAATRNHGWVPIDDVIACLFNYIITIDSDKK